MPFACPSSRFTRDFEQLVAWLATKMDKDAFAAAGERRLGHRGADL